MRGLERQRSASKGHGYAYTRTHNLPDDTGMSELVCRQVFEPWDDSAVGRDGDKLQMRQRQARYIELAAKQLLLARRDRKRWVH